LFFKKKKEIRPEIFTEEVCQACGEKSRRRFEDGDYVFKPASACKNCSSSNTIIGAIYGEYPPETKNNSNKA
jgi:hypothetical protein